MKIILFIDFAYIIMYGYYTKNLIVILLLTIDTIVSML